MADDSADADPVGETVTAVDDADDVTTEDVAGEAVDDAADGDDTGDDPDEVADDTDQDTTKRKFPVAVLVSSLLLVALLGMTAWVGYTFYQTWQEQQRQEMFVDAARQGALNLTTIDWEHAEADVQRVLDSATGQFYDDFERRSQSFLEVVKQIKSKSTGTVTSAALESYSGDSAEVLVSATIESTNAGVPEQEPQVWRMVVTVQGTDGTAKVSNVEFVQ